MLIAFNLPFVEHANLIEIISYTIIPQQIIYNALLYNDII